MNFDGEPIYNFDFKKIEIHCDNLSSNNKKIDYLSAIKKALSLAEAIGHKIPDDFNEQFIEKSKTLLSRLTKTKEIIAGTDEALNDFKNALKTKAPQLAKLISDRISQEEPADITRQDIWNIFSNPSYEGSKEYLKAFFQLPPFFGFDVEALELGLNNQPTIEQQAAYVLNILEHYPFVIAYKAEVPVAYSDKLVEIVSSLKLELKLIGQKKQQITFEELKQEGAEFIPDIIFEPIMEKCNKIKSTQDQFEYLEWILKEYENWIDSDFSGWHYDFENKSKVIPRIKREIDYRQRILSRQEQSNAKTNQDAQTQLEKIQWQGTEAQIVFLFEELIKQGYLSKAFELERYKLIAQHFLNKKNQPFKPTQLAQTYQNQPGTKTGKPEKAAEIENILGKMKKK